jgi:hypothetical protein
MTTISARPAPPPAEDGAPARTGWTAGRIVGTVASAVVLALSSVLILAGVTVVAGAAVLRSDDGLYHTDPAVWSSPGYAARSREVHLHSMPMLPGSPDRITGTVRITATSTRGQPIFLGIAQRDDADRYLGQVPHSTFAPPWDSQAAHFDLAGGLPPAVAPGQFPIWIASASGAGEQELTWTPRRGRWCLVVMNSDGSAPVSADVRFAAELPVVDFTGATLLISGAVLLVASGLGLWLALPRSRQPSINQE